MAQLGLSLTAGVLSTAASTITSSFASLLTAWSPTVGDGLYLPQLALREDTGESDYLSELSRILLNDPLSLQPMPSRGRRGFKSDETPSRFLSVAIYIIESVVLVTSVCEASHLNLSVNVSRSTTATCKLLHRARCRPDTRRRAQGAWRPAYHWFIANGMILLSSYVVLSSEKKRSLNLILNFALARHPGCSGRKVTHARYVALYLLCRAAGLSIIGIRHVYASIELKIMAVA